MQFVRTALGTLTGLTIFWSLSLYILDYPTWRWCIAGLAFCMSITIYLKGFYIGTDSLRGRFHLILGTGAGLLAIAIIGTLMEIPQPLMISLHCLARLVLLVSVTLMFIGLKKQGYTLSAGEWLEVLMVYFALAGTGLWFFYMKFAVTDILLTVLVYLSLMILLVTMSVVRIYLGSNLGWRWTAGAVGVLFISLGDMAMAYGSSAALAVSTSTNLEALQYGAWGALCFIMTLVSLQFE